MKYLRIIGWDELFEIAQSRKLKRLGWVAIPNTNAEDEAYSCILDREDKIEIFTAYILMVRVASTMPKRGTFINKRGKKLSADDFRKMTRYPKQLFDKAIDFFIEQGLMEWVDSGTVPPKVQDVLGKDPGCYSYSGNAVAAESY